MPQVGPFSESGTFFKGCLHVHSTESDGKLGPANVLDWYRGRGYHFVALSDHRICSESRVYGPDFITLSAVEMDTWDPDTGLCHLVGLGVKGLRQEQIPRDTTAQAALDTLRESATLVLLAHPYWSGQMSKDLLDLEGLVAVEVYNGACEVDTAKGLSAVHWDDMLAAGRRVWGVAVDDAHWRNGSKDAGLGWVWAKAQELAQESILEALAAGMFYSSSGPLIYDMGVDGDNVWVRCSPAKSIDFVSNVFHSCRVSAGPGQPLTEATMHLKAEQTYVRVACQDYEGQWAWSNPVFLV
jgi:hypothetical protein